MAAKQTRIAALPAALALGTFFALFRTLPLDVASALGGWIARKIGKYLKWHRVAEANLRAIYPTKTESEIQQILRDMWDNLGRNLAEYPCLSSKKLQSRIEFENPYLPPAAIFAAAHLGNWEVAPLGAFLHDVPMTLIYRRVNNPLVEKMIYAIRSRHCAGLYPKGKRGAAEVLRALKAGRALGLLIDQKMNDGIEVPFMGRPAMTAQATAELALRFEVPIVMARVVRLHGANFRMETKPLEFGAEETPAEIMLKINQQLEQWINEFPAQWLWIHRRWGKI